ncbi:MAG: cytochrome c3 family protein [Deltaproteobacteria bacterium]|nr:cytochrome c3 family protein [Deltaproteobacteria bacterium]
MMTPSGRTIFILLSLLILPCPGRAIAGPYLNSVHGNNTIGVNRSAMAAAGYARGNCAHCHEQHASVNGSTPAGGPHPFNLFANNFSGKQTGPYVQADDFCFYCHISTGAVQSEGGITNRQYSNTFGGYPTDSATDIIGAFNLGSASYVFGSNTLYSSSHNLYDIWRFAKTKFPFFKDSSNPCAACHNPHLVKQNKAHPTDPSYAAIARPTDHGHLWGDDANERMNKYNTYRSPFFYNSTSMYEPGGVSTRDGSDTPDYVTFCLDCHQYQVPTTQSASKNPNTPAGYLTAIDWGPAGDMHGERTRNFGINGEGSESYKCRGTVISPYNTTPVASNYVLSCLDCHEPHGSVLAGKPSSYLLRKEINNNVVTGCGPAGEQSFCNKDLCYSCHTNDHAGPNGCLLCHYHGARNEGCGGPRPGPDF